MFVDATPAGILLRDEIAREGEISFERFMEVALYHPEFGYYRTEDPFGTKGDFVTATQLPVFGRLLRERLSRWNLPPVIVDWGAGRGDLAEAFEGWTYHAVDVDRTAPGALEGFLVANELFDALPVRCFAANEEEARVTWTADGFAWTATPVREECPQAARVLREMSGCLTRGIVVVIDYGYTEREQAIRFPQGSLMSYRRQRASEHVLREPGKRDITAHVNFTKLEQEAVRAGFRVVERVTLRRFLMDGGEAVIAAAANENGPAVKTLLFGMGESFDVLTLEK